MILDVPYQSQQPLEENGAVRKWCGIACLWMVMAYFLKDQAPKIEQLLQKCGAEFEAAGFLHQDLIKIARVYGLSGFRKSWWAQPGIQALLDKFKSEGESDQDLSGWMEINIDESLHTLEQLIHQDTPVIISVNQDFSPSSSTHLVVLVGVEDDNFIIHDPYKRGANFKISQEEFKKYWLRQAIVIKQ